VDCGSCGRAFAARLILRTSFEHRAWRKARRRARQQHVGCRQTTSLPRSTGAHATVFGLSRHPARAGGERVADAGYACRLGQPGTCGGSTSSGIQILGHRDRRGDCQSKGCSTAWRMRPNHQCARFDCRARDRSGPLLSRCSKPSCNCPLGMRNLCFGMPTQRQGNLTQPEPTKTLAAARHVPDILLYASAYPASKIGPSRAGSK
jgi:hypothetical protein